MVTDGPLFENQIMQWIELYNTTGSEIEIGVVFSLYAF